MVIGRAISPLVISIATLLIALRITTHEPPSRGSISYFRRPLNGDPSEPYVRLS